MVPPNTRYAIDRGLIRALDGNTCPTRWTMRPASSSVSRSVKHGTGCVERPKTGDDQFKVDEGDAVECLCLVGLPVTSSREGERCCHRRGKKVIR